MVMPEAGPGTKYSMRVLVFLLFFLAGVAHAQVYVADNGDGTYSNPVIHADYSDPDVIRVGEDYYMISSSFNFVPGLPVLHSRDLVNWSLIGYALTELAPSAHFKKVRHGGGVWAPAIRYYKGKFRIYYPDPDFGIYVTTATDIRGPWTDPVLVKAGKGFIDPCPFWDDDGRAYLSYAFAGSRAGVKSVLMLVSMNDEGTRAYADDAMIFDGQKGHPTVEGPKVYKRNGYYYLSAPAGGVATGWQLVLRARNIYGPYEEKIVLRQGDTPVNGPHQGAWVDTPAGEWWFLHFQDKDAYGRIVHLQPMTWEDNWPVIGIDGQPVLRYKKPLHGFPVAAPAESDEFNSPQTGLQWQWAANRETVFGFPSSGGYFRLNTLKTDSSGHLYDFPNFFSQKFPAEEFTATTRLEFSFNPQLKTEQLGFMVKGYSYAFAGLMRRNGVNYVTYNEWSGKAARQETLGEIRGNSVYFRVKVGKGALCDFYYSEDGVRFTKMNKTSFPAQKGHWVGARIGYIAARAEDTNDSGFMNIDWFRTEK